MSEKFTTFIYIMLFYAILSCVIGPLIFYFLGGKSLQIAGNGFVVFSVISILLWYTKGSKMV
jgi:membrane protein implicated in regulation of membrane protease activity